MVAVDPVLVKRAKSSVCFEDITIPNSSPISVLNNIDRIRSAADQHDRRCRVLVPITVLRQEHVYL